MIDERELRVSLGKWLHFQMAAAQNLQWEEGDTCEDCQELVNEELFPMMETLLRERAEIRAAAEVLAILGEKKA